MNVVVTNVFADNNKGGCVLTQAAIEFAHRLSSGPVRVSLMLVDSATPADQQLRHTLGRYPDVEILQPVFGSVERRLGGWVTALCSLVALVLGRRVAATSISLRRLAEADVVISKGGHVFVNRRRWRRLLSAWITGFPLVYANRCGVSTVALGASIGPFSVRRARLVAGFVLRRLTIVSPRDPESAAWARRLRVRPDRIRDLPDGIFAFEPETADVANLMAERGLRPGRFVALATGYDGGDGERFIEALDQMVRELIGTGRVDMAAIVLQQMTSKGRSADRELSEALLARLGDRAVLIEDDLSPDALIEFYSHAALVGGRRLHATLFGLVAGVPVLPIVHPAESSKARQVFGGIGLEDLIVDARERGDLIERARTASAAWPIERIQRILSEQRAAWDQGADDVAATISRAREVPQEGGG